MQHLTLVLLLDRWRSCECRNGLKCSNTWPLMVVWWRSYDEGLTTPHWVTMKYAVDAATVDVVPSFQTHTMSNWLRRPYSISKPAARLDYECEAFLCTYQTGCSYTHWLKYSIEEVAEVSMQWRPFNQPQSRLHTFSSAAHPFFLLCESTTCLISYYRLLRHVSTVCLTTMFVSAVIIVSSNQNIFQQSYPDIMFWPFCVFLRCDCFLGHRRSSN